MKIRFLVLFVYAFSLIGCGEAKQTKVEEDVPAVDSTKIIQQDTVASVSKTAEAQMDENVIMEIWEKYLVSNYCDIPSGFRDIALSEIVLTRSNVALVKLDGSNRPIIYKNNLDVANEDFASDENSEDDEVDVAFEDYYVPNVTETFACYPLKTGGYLVLWYYDASDWGRKIFAVYSYKDKQLVRLKNSFPPFDSEFIDSNPSFDWDELVKLNGTEVVYFRQDCWPTRFDDEGFGMSLGGMEETKYKFDGEKFVKE